MDGLKIFWTQTAKNQRDYIFDYWNTRNKSKNYSKKLNLSIKARIELLRSQPKLGKETDFKDARVVSMGHYSILYKMDKTNIYIIGFWDNRQDPKKLLKFLKRG